MKETVRPQDNVAGEGTHQPEKLAGAPLYSVGWCCIAVLTVHGR